ncbi:hypothetical protein [Ornithinibacillus massiliensis]|uniref:hypothetical protein n=1 Tax=Ornithinibacillus massiliensis TaxID=1944633 RepID=UPI001BAA65D7|nr:hypothetical protein [Ornithinibacillus massiliensis]
MKNATKVLKVEPTLENIDKRYKQLDKWTERLNNNDNYIRWKDKAIEEASQHFSWINSLEKQIQESEKKIENINWLNPMRLKENKTVKDRLEQTISQAKDQIISHKQKLNYYCEKLGFSNEKEFNEVKSQHEMERPALLEKSKNNRQYIQYERGVLQKAENALKNDFVRRVASLYPERPEMAYMSFKTAIKVMEFNRSYGKGEVIPIERVPEFKEQMQLREGGISLFNALVSGINQAERGMLEDRKKTQEMPLKSKKKKKQRFNGLER